MNLQWTWSSAMFCTCSMKFGSMLPAHAQKSHQFGVHTPLIWLEYRVKLYALIAADVPILLKYLTHFGWEKNHTSISLRLALRRTFAVISRSWFGGSNTGRMNISIGAKCCENGFRLSKKRTRAVWMGAAGNVLMPARSYIELKTDVSWGHGAEQMPAMRNSAKLMVRALKHPKQPTTLGMDKNSGYCKQQLTAKIVPWQLVTNVGIQQKCLWTNKTLVNSRGTMYHMFPSIGSIDTPDVQEKRLQKKKL